MSALAEALVAAQRRALQATEKAYVAGALTRDEAVTELNAFGLTDEVDIVYLLAALDVVRLRGAALPAEPANGGEKVPDKASDAQLALIAKLVKDKNVAAPELPITKQDAHVIIDTLKNGTYDAAKWSVPF